MYFHPLILTEAQKKQRLAACQDFARLWLDGIDRQYRLHMKAVSEFGARQQENLRALSEATDITHFLVRWSASEPKWAFVDADTRPLSTLPQGATLTTRRNLAAGG